jgi:hypothetical protein
MGLEGNIMREPEILNEVSMRLDALINFIDRSAFRIENEYPNWDTQDTAEVKSTLLNRLTEITNRVQEI